MRMILHDAPGRILPTPGSSSSHPVSVMATEPSTSPGTRPPGNARPLAHRPGPGCPCGCTFDALTHRCIEPWNPPADGNDLGPLFFG